METVLMILPAVYIVGMVALALAFGAGGQQATNRDSDDDDVVGVFDDVTDPAKSYLIYNVHHDDSAMEDNSYSWDDSSLVDDMFSSSWDD